MIYPWPLSFSILILLLSSTALHGAAPAPRPRGYSSASSQTAISPRGEDESSSSIKRVSSARRNTTTLLHLACAEGDIAAIRWELETGSAEDINAKNPLGQTPLMLACQHRAGLAAIQRLLGEGASIDEVDALSATLLHYACEGGDSAVVELLLKTYNVPIKYCFAKGYPNDTTNDKIIKKLIKKHKELLECVRMAALADVPWPDLAEEDKGEDADDDEWVEVSAEDTH